MHMLTLTLHRLTQTACVKNDKVALRNLCVSMSLPSIVMASTAVWDRDELENLITSRAYATSSVIFHSSAL
jgi:hypothetical protein